MSLIKVTKDNKLALQRLPTDLRSAVNKVSLALKGFFEDLIDGKIGDELKKITLDLFDGWCARYDVPLLRNLFEAVKMQIQEIISSSNEERGRMRDKLVKEITQSLRIDTNRAGKIIDECITNAFTSQRIEEVTWPCAKNLTEDHTKLFIDQTAHVIVARLLVHRILECKGYHMGGQLPQDPLDVLVSIRRLYEGVLPNIFSLSEFDWWYVPDILRPSKRDELRLLQRHEDVLKKSIQEVLKLLSQYDLSQVDFDVWQEVYQYYLPDAERQRLGGFYTPRELVALIEDLSHYVPESEGLCTKRVLDPACGSGTFIVEAASRLIKHLESKYPCHNLPKVEWERSKYIIDKVKSNIYAIDIHPFATFLTSLNLTMLLLDHFMNVYHQDKTYKLEFNVITADSLLKHVQASVMDYANARVKETLKRFELYKRVLNVKFDYVFGNPPWGTVLKGELSPLWNPKKREEYKKLYKSAVGKYDICVLFLERGLEWLKPGGILGMVVNNRFLTRDFGEVIRCLIANSSKVLYLIDFSEFGEDLFEATNYPLVMILLKEREGGELCEKTAIK